MGKNLVRLACFALAAGCSSGPAPETTLGDVRVVALDATTPEVAPGDEVALDALVADPKGGGTRLAMWTCTSIAPPGGDPACLESAVGWGVGTGASTLIAGEPEAERFTASLVTPAALAGVLTDEFPALPVTVWALACRDDLCPVLDAIDAAIDDGAVDDALAADLADPAAWLAGLPFDGVSLARRSIVVSNRPAEERNTNPVLTVEPPAAFSPDVAVDVVVEAEDAEGDAITVAPYTTAGGFGTILQLLVEAQPSTLPLYGPADGDSVRIYVTATDGVGGSASWSGDVPVE